MSEYIAILDILIAPMLLSVVFLNSQFLLMVRVGLAVLALGLFFQSFVVFVGLYQLDGWGQLWMVKDIGAAIITIRGMIYVFARW